MRSKMLRTLLIACFRYYFLANKLIDEQND